jgi:glycerophosphoryl diester phosphodiesterase
MSRTNLPREFVERRDRPFILAHRGCRARAPENTIPAFELALEQGADAIETDLRITRDRVIVCIHDDTIDRTTDGHGRVEEMTWDEIRLLRAQGNNAQEYPEARVPSLTELLAVLGHRTYLALELKAPAFTSRADCDLLLDTLADSGVVGRVMALSFSREALLCLRDAGASVPLGYIAALNPWPPSHFPLVGPWWPLLLLNPLYALVCHRRGQVCAPLDPKPEPRLRLYRRLRMDALLSDDPGLTLEALEGLAT